MTESNRRGGEANKPGQEVHSAGAWMLVQSYWGKVADSAGHIANQQISLHPGSDSEASYTLSSAVSTRLAKGMLTQNTATPWRHRPERQTNTRNTEHALRLRHRALPGYSGLLHAWGSARGHSSTAILHN